MSSDVHVNPDAVVEDPKERSASQQRIDKFMRLAEQKLPEFPETPSEEVRLLRAKLIIEEAFETVKGLGVAMKLYDNSYDECDVTTEFMSFHIDGPFDMIETVDGCCDLNVVSTGTLSALGVSDVVPQKAVDQNNLAKFGPGGYKGPTGKWIKPPDHRPPDIRGCLLAQGWKP